MIVVPFSIDIQVIADQLRVEKEREAELDMLYQLVQFVHVVLSVTTISVGRAVNIIILVYQGGSS